MSLLRQPNHIETNPFLLEYEVPINPQQAKRLAEASQHLSDLAIKGRDVALVEDDIFSANFIPLSDPGHKLFKMLPKAAFSSCSIVTKGPFGAAAESSIRLHGTARSSRTIDLTLFGSATDGVFFVSDSAFDTSDKADPSRNALRHATLPASYVSRWLIDEIGEAVPYNNALEILATRAPYTGAVQAGSLALPGGVTLHAYTKTVRPTLSLTAQPLHQENAVWLTAAFDDTLLIPDVEIRRCYRAQAKQSPGSGNDVKLYADVEAQQKIGNDLPAIATLAINSLAENLHNPEHVIRRFMKANEFLKYFPGGYTA